MFILSLKGIRMEIFPAVVALTLILILILFGLKAVKWVKKMPKAAFIFMALMPLISLFPIPPPVFKNIAKAKQEQPKRKQDNGDDK